MRKKRIIKQLQKIHFFLEKKKGMLVTKKNAYHDNNLKRKVKEDRKHQYALIERNGDGMQAIQVTGKNRNKRGR